MRLCIYSSDGCWANRLEIYFEGIISELVNELHEEMSLSLIFCSLLICYILNGLKASNGQFRLQQARMCTIGYLK